MAKAVGVSISGLETDFLAYAKSFGADDSDLQILRGEFSSGEFDAAGNGYTIRNARTLSQDEIEEVRNKVQKPLEMCRKAK